jgi:hypothetical protein
MERLAFLVSGGNKGDGFAPKMADRIVDCWRKVKREDEMQGQFSSLTFAPLQTPGHNKGRAQQGDALGTTRGRS